MATWTLSTPRNFGFVPTVYSHGWFQCPPFHWDAATLTLGRVLEGAHGQPRWVTLRQETRGALTVCVDGRAPGARGRLALDRQISTILHLDRDLRGFHRLCRKLPALRRLPRLGAGRMLRNPTLWEDVTKGICGTNVAWPQAVQMMERLCRFGAVVDDAGHHAWPRPEDLLRAGARRLRERCRVGYRADSLLAVARVAERAELLTLEPARLDPAELRARLLALRGIGPATAAYLLAVHGHCGELSVDSAVIAFTARKHFGGRRPTPSEVRTLYAPHGEWQALVYLFEFLQEAWWPSIGVRL